MHKIASVPSQIGRNLTDSLNGSLVPTCTKNSRALTCRLDHLIELHLLIILSLWTTSGASDFEIPAFKFLNLPDIARAKRARRLFF